jgi:hypothetical protein
VLGGASGSPCWLVEIALTVELILAEPGGYTEATG